MDSPRLSTVIGLTVTALLIGALAWWWLATSRQHDNVETTARHGEQITESIPGIAAAFGRDSVGQMGEDSCVGSPDPERASRNTRWVAHTGTFVSSMQEARKLARAVREEAEADGWSTEPFAGPHQEGLLRATRGELTLVISASTTGGKPTVSLSMTSPCLDKPAGHTMTRSEYDPMYGSADPMYPHDDRSKFTNGESKPFRTTSPTDASSTT